MTYNLPLDLYHWLVLTFAGSTIIFFALAFTIIVTMAAFFRMSNMITLVAISLFVILFSYYLGSLFILFIFIAGILIFWAIIKIWSR